MSSTARRKPPSVMRGTLAVAALAYGIFAALKHSVCPAAGSIPEG